VVDDQAAIDERYFGAYGPDYEASIKPDVPQIYANRINSFFTDTDIRLAFGVMYPHRAEDGLLHPETRYGAAIWMTKDMARAVARHLLSLTDPTPEVSATDSPSKAE